MRPAAIALVLLLTVALLWTASEIHYRNCLNTAPDRVGTHPEWDSSRYTRATARERDTCSRLP